MNYCGTNRHIQIHLCTHTHESTLTSCCLQLWRQKTIATILFALCTLLNTLAATAAIHIATYSYCMLQHHVYWYWQQICKPDAGTTSLCLTLVQFVAICAHLVVCFIVVIVVMAVIWYLRCDSLCLFMCTLHTHTYTHLYTPTYTCNRIGNGLQ